MDQQISVLQGAVIIGRYRVSFDVRVLQINIPIVHRTKETGFYLRAPAAMAVLLRYFCNPPVFQPGIVKTIRACQIMMFVIRSELEHMSGHGALHRLEILPVGTMVPTTLAVGDILHVFAPGLFTLCFAAITLAPIVSLREPLANPAS